MSNKITFNTNILHEPIIELYRGKIYCNIIKYFIMITTKYLDSKIFSVKKSYPRTLTNILSSWIFTLYAFNKSRQDSFFPDNYENIIILKRTLLDFCKYDTTIENSEEIIDNILNQFIDYYLNGKLIKSEKKSTILATPPDGNTPLYLGNTPFLPFDAYLGRVIRWSSPVDPQTAWDTYLSGNGVSSSVTPYHANLSIMKDHVTTSTYKLW